VGSVIVTGSSGFIGSHLCDRLQKNAENKTQLTGLDRSLPTFSQNMPFVKGDLANEEDLNRLGTCPSIKVFHLAAEAEVVIPVARLQKFIDSNVSGTINVLKTLNPEVLFFASSSAVYGHKNLEGTSVDWDFINPVGVYGMSKAMAELICQRWAVENGRTAVAFRFGNVIGPGCRGFIPFLVNHAMQYSDGTVAAQCRGGGKIIRDYLPVSYLTKVLERALEMPWQAGSHHAFNVGTGQGLTNKAVAEIVTGVLRQAGLRLSINWDNPLAGDESRSIILSPQKTERIFNLATPHPDEVVAAIEETVRHLLGTT
jgi:nucleoside-diphosphate-sugar epimerase